MASYTRRLVAAGVQLVGGCCGTTPDHIRAMKAALRARVSATQSRFQIVRHRRSALCFGKHGRSPSAPDSGAKLAGRELRHMVEIVPPRGNDISGRWKARRFLKSVGIDAINIPDSPRASARMSNQALCLLMQQQVGIETVLHYTCRDRNVLSIQCDLLGASALGIRNLICITGDPPKMGNYPDATAVFDVDSIGLVNMVHNLNRGVDIRRQFHRNWH